MLVIDFIQNTGTGTVMDLAGGTMLITRTRRVMLTDLT